MTKQEARDYLAELEKALPGITTKPMPPYYDWTIRGEMLGEWLPPSAVREPSHGLYQMAPQPLSAAWRRAFDPIANMRAFLRIVRKP